MLTKNLFSVLIILLLPATRVSAEPFPPNVHRILFLGNSITYDGRYIEDIETYFITHYPEQHYEFINVGLPSETVSGLSEEGHAGGRFPRPDLHERLARILEQTKPDFVFANYGMNDGIYMPLDEQRFQKFKDGIMWLHNEVTKSGIPIVHLTPPIYDDEKGGNKGYSAVLDRYALWLLDYGKKEKWQVADIHFAMKKVLDKRRKKDPLFALADDGVHPGAFGHWIMAKQVLLYLGEKRLKNKPDLESTLSKNNNGEAIYALVKQRQQMMKDAWLTSTKHTRPEMNKGLPLDEAKTKNAEIEKQVRALFKTQE